MNEAKHIAKEDLLSAALRLVSSRLYLDAHAGYAYDDAEREMNDDMFEEAVRAYVEAAAV